jgi:hypothetical protein
MHKAFKNAISEENIAKIFNRQYPLMEREFHYNTYNISTNKLLAFVTFISCLIGFISPLIIIYDYGLIDSIRIFTFNFDKTNTTFFI